MSSYFHILTLVTPEFDVLTYLPHDADSVIDEIALHRDDFASVTMTPYYYAYNKWVEEESVRRGMNIPRPMDGPSDKAGARKYLEALSWQREEEDEMAHSERVKRPRTTRQSLKVEVEQVRNDLHDDARRRHRQRAEQRRGGQENEGMPFAFTFSYPLNRPPLRVNEGRRQIEVEPETDINDVSKVDADEGRKGEEYGMEVDEEWEEEGSIDSVDSLLGGLEWVYEEDVMEWEEDDTYEYHDQDHEMRDDHDYDDYETDHEYAYNYEDYDEMEVEEGDDYRARTIDYDYQPIYPIFNPDIWRQVEAQAVETIAARAAAAVTTVQVQVPVSIVEPVIEPVLETIVEPMVEPSIELRVERVVEEVVRPVVEPVVVATVESLVRPIQAAVGGTEVATISLIDQNLRKQWEEAEERQEEDDIVGLLEGEGDGTAEERTIDRGRPDPIVSTPRRRVGGGAGGKRRKR